MRTRGSRYAFLILLLPVALALLLPTCGGDEDEATPEGTATAAASATPAAPATAAPSAQFGPGVTDTEIVLGQHAPLSGGLGAVYAQVPSAQQAYYRYVNEEKGGVCGRKIVLKVEDDAGDPARALEVTRKLVEQDKVFAMVGSLGDVNHGAVWDYLNENGVPDLFIIAGAHRFSSDPEGHPWTVQMIPDYLVEGSFYGRYISQEWPDKKVAVLYENDDTGRDGLAGVRRGLDPSKNQIVSEQPYEATAVDIRPQLIAMKDAGAEVVVLYSTIGFTAQAIKGADRMGWKPQFIAGYVNSDAILFQFVSPKLAAGLISFQCCKMPDWTDDPAVAEHHRIMSQYGGPTPSIFSVVSHLQAELVVDVFSRSCDNLTREGVMHTTLNEIRDWRSGLLVEGATVTLSDKDRRALETGPMERVVEENGRGRWEYFGGLWEFREE
jgi:ABC-type branched-subunit amino acid transport system substrate-binding protein